MALSGENWDIINKNLFIEGAKYWRTGYFNQKTGEEQYICFEYKRTKCPCWYEGTPLEDWIDNMSRPGVMVDHYWLSAAAKMLGRCIVLIPSFVQSSTHIGRIIRVWGGKSTAEHPETAGVQPPLFLGYMEDNLYTGPVF